MSVSNTQPSFELEIITPKKISSYLIYMIEVETPSGSFTIAEEHAPLISSLKKKGIATFQSNVGITHIIHIENGGLFKVVNNKAQLILHQLQI
jgi:F0F1-type ATP synthase epsilon subunit